MVYKKNDKVLPSLRISTLSKNHNIRKIKFKSYMKIISGGLIGGSNYIGTSLNG